MKQVPTKFLQTRKKVKHFFIEKLVFRGFNF